MLPRKAKTMSLLPAHVPDYAEDKLVWYGPLALCPSCPRFVLFVHSVCVSYTIYIQPTGRALLKSNPLKIPFSFDKKKSVVNRKKRANASVLSIVIIAGCNQNNISFSLSFIPNVFSLCKRNISFSAIFVLFPFGGHPYDRAVGRRVWSLLRGE